MNLQEQRNRIIKLMGLHEESLLAPNGKPSNLSPDLYKLVRTKSFKNWFGDWENNPESASKVVDENGEPLPTYHGTNWKGKIFQTSYAEGWGTGIYTTNNIQNAQEYGERIIPIFLKIINPVYSFNANKTENDVLTTSAWKNYEKKIAAKVMGILQDNIEKMSDSDLINLRIEYFDDQNKSFADFIDVYQENIEVINKAWRELGYDGIIATDSNNIEGFEIVAFYPEQLKLADGKNVTFDTNNPDIENE